MADVIVLPAICWCWAATVVVDVVANVVAAFVDASNIVDVDFDSLIVDAFVVGLGPRTCYMLEVCCLLPPLTTHRSSWVQLELMMEIAPPSKPVAPKVLVGS